MARRRFGADATREDDSDERVAGTSAFDSSAVGVGYSHNRGLHFRGRIAVHAALGMTRAEYEEGRAFIDRLGYDCPDPHALIRGAICGSVEIVDVVAKSDSPWFFGPRGLVLSEPRTCYAIPCKGALGFFRWQSAGELPTSPKWMTPAAPTLQATMMALQPMPDLFAGRGDE